MSKKSRLFDQSIWRKLFLTVCVCICTLSLFAQGTITVTGVVKDTSGELFPGVNVTVKGTAIGVVSDINGHYSLRVSDKKAVLVFSFIGTATQEIIVGNRTNINVTLVEVSDLLDEVVVVGYGTQKKTSLTGSVSALKGDQLRNV
ncbi:TonB-dependent receptor SusC, partial [termite gut metagenome]